MTTSSALTHKLYRLVAQASPPQSQSLSVSKARTGGLPVVPDVEWYRSAFSKGSASRVPKGGFASWSRSKSSLRVTGNFRKKSSRVRMFSGVTPCCAMRLRLNGELYQAY